MFPEVLKINKLTENCGDDYSMVLLYDRHLDDTILSGKNTSVEISL